MGTIEQMRHKRFQFLHKLYLWSIIFAESWDSDEHQPFAISDIGSELGFDWESSRVIAEYLAAEGLVEIFIGTGVSLTDSAVNQIEQAILEPHTPTRYFPPVVNIISAEQIIDSQLQQASPAATQVAYSDNTHEQLKQLLEWLKDSVAELHLEDQDKSDFQAELQKIEAQTSKSKPSQAIITESLRAIRSILEEVSAILLAQALLQRIAEFLRGG